MSKIFKLKNYMLFNREDVESYYTDNEFDPYNIKLVVNMRSGNSIVVYIDSTEFHRFYKDWSEWMKIPAVSQELPKYKQLDNKTKPFIYKNLIIREPESIKALDLVKEYKEDWCIMIMFDHTDFNIYFNEDELKESTSEEREKEARRVYDRLRKWAGFPDQLPFGGESDE